MDFITDIGFEHVCKVFETNETGIQHPHLTNLSLIFRGCEQITSAELIKLSNTISKSNAQLQFLYMNFQDCNLLVDEGNEDMGLAIQAIYEKLNLLALSPSECENIKDTGVMKLVKSILNNKAQLISLSLDISRCTQVTDITMGKYVRLY